MIRFKQGQKTGVLFVLFVLLLFGPVVLADQNKGSIPESVPDMIVSVDSGKDACEYAIVVEKSTQQVLLYACDESCTQVSRMNCSTGEVAGVKSRSGDRKTPEGVYFFTRQHKKKDLTPIYGTRAFPIDYPNSLDRFYGNGGNAIWMHGTNKPIKDRDTNGCIVLANPDIDKLANYITLNKTPIIIVDRISYGSVESSMNARKSILGIVSLWKNALEKGTYHEYLKFYDSDYVPDITWWSDWSSLRKDFSLSGHPFSIELKRTSILKHNETYVVLFDQGIRLSGKDIPAGSKKLFIASKGGQLKIVGEEYQARPEALKERKDENPLVATLHFVKSKTREENEIVDLIDGWLKAWSSKDISRYGSYYAKDFRSQGMNLRAWLKHKKRLNRKYDYILVSKDNLVVKKGKRRATASFYQTYESSSYKATGSKKLVLKREGGRWKIYRETWKKT